MGTTAPAGSGGASQAGDGSWSATQLTDSTYNISGWGEDAAGELYLAKHDGSVYKLTPTPNPSPAASGLVPSAVIAGDPDFELAVDGAGFVYGSVVRWNGSDRPTTFVSSARVTAADPRRRHPRGRQRPGHGLLAGAGRRHLGAADDQHQPDVPRRSDRALRLRLHPGRLRRRRHGRMRCLGSTVRTNTTTRAQMAVFLLKASEGSTYVPPPCSGAFFARRALHGRHLRPVDRGPGRPRDHGRLRGRQLLPGRRRDAGPDVGLSPQDEPGTVVHTARLHRRRVRGRALHGRHLRSVDRGPGRPARSPAAAAAATTVPSNPVTRAQMAIFLTKTFELPLP